VKELRGTAMVGILQTTSPLSTIENENPMIRTNRLSILYPVWSVICMMLMFAALHDIANETDVALEYAALGCCLAWFVGVAIGLLRRRHQLLGAVTLIGVAIMTWDQAAFYVGRLQASMAERLLTRAAFAALVIVTVALFTLMDESGGNNALEGRVP
jgi:hypothetical protein